MTTVPGFGGVVAVPGLVGVIEVAVFVGVVEVADLVGVVELPGFAGVAALPEFGPPEGTGVGVFAVRRVGMGAVPGVADSELWPPTAVFSLFIGLQNCTSFYG